MRQRPGKGGRCVGGARKNYRRVEVGRRLGCKGENDTGGVEEGIEEGLEVVGVEGDA